MSISREDEQWESEEREDMLLQEISDLKRQLAEARAALLEAEDNLSYTATSWWMIEFRARHAAALKAMREAK